MVCITIVYIYIHIVTLVSVVSCDIDRMEKEDIILVIIKIVP